MLAGVKTGCPAAYEANKISAARFQTPLTLRSFSATGRTVDAINNQQLDELYDIQKGTDIVKPLAYIANQLIHSYIFVPVFKERNVLQGIAFNSDKSKSRELYMIKLLPLVEAFAACANSILSSVTYFRLENGQLRVVPHDDA